MVVFQSNVRFFTSCLLIGVLSGLMPAAAAPPPPGTPASGPAPLVAPLLDVASITALPRSGQEAASPTKTGAPTPARRHVSPWVWAAIAAGIGVGVGAGVILGNKQSARTAAVTPSATLGTSGSVTVGAP